MIMVVMDNDVFFAWEEERRVFHWRRSSFWLRWRAGNSRDISLGFVQVSFVTSSAGVWMAFGFHFFFFDLLFRFSHVFWHVIIGWRLTRRAPFLAPFRTRSAALSGHFQSSCTADFDRFFSSCFTITLQLSSNFRPILEPFQCNFSSVSKPSGRITHYWM